MFLGGGWVLTKCLQGLIQATRSTVLDVTKLAFRAQILRDVSLQKWQFLTPVDLV